MDYKKRNSLPSLSPLSFKGLKNKDGIGDLLGITSELDYIKVTWC